MGLFDFGKKKQKTQSCCCGGNCSTKTVENLNKTASGNSNIKILGGGCAKCNELESNTVKALEQLGMNTTIEHVTDFAIIATYGVMQTPAIVLGNKVLSYGKVIKTEEIIKLIKKEL